MIKAAIQKGGNSLGFAEHAYVEFDLYYSMTPEMTSKYVSKVKALKEKYKNRIDVFLGLEVDYYTETVPEGLDYIIGTSHYLKKDGSVFPVDSGSRQQQEFADKFFDGDFYSMAEAYFSMVSKIVDRTNANIVGHFDLVAKYNADGSKFDEMHPRYVDAALDSMGEILKKCRIFEVNTGAMYRLGKSEPYPSGFFLKELLKRGGEVVLTSDSHDADSLFYKFDEVQELLKSIGFKYIKRLTNNGFIDIKL